MGDQGVFQADRQFVHGFGPEGFEISFGPSVEIGHDERQLVLGPGRPQQARDGRQLVRRLARESHDQRAHAVAKRVGAGAGPQDAVVQDGDVVGDPLHVIQQVGREEDRALAAAGEVDHGLEQGPAGGGVQAGGRVVEHQHLRLDRQRHRQVEAGALAVRQVPGLGARVDREVVDHGGEDFLIPVMVEAALKSPVLADPHPAVDGMSLGHVTDPGAGFGREGGAVAAEDDRTSRASAPGGPGACGWLSSCRLRCGR